MYVGRAAASTGEGKNGESGEFRVESLEWSVECGVWSWKSEELGVRSEELMAAAARHPKAFPFGGRRHSVSVRWPNEVRSDEVSPLPHS